MGKTKGSKNLTPKQREDIKYIIGKCLIYRKSNEEILEEIEDAGYDISMSMIKVLKQEVRLDSSKRFKDIGEWELVHEHNLAIDVMKLLEKKAIESLDKAENESERMRIMAEIRNIIRDKTDYYGSADIVEAVFRHFNDNKEEEKTEKAKNVK